MWNPETYTIAASLLPRLLGFVYFVAIVPFLFQIKGLLGKNGILPISDFLAYFKTNVPKKRFIYVPSLFWINASDAALIGLAVLGTCISVVLMFGYAPPLCLAGLFIIYLSIVSVGQDFLSFGWESFLLEITFFTFLVSLTPIPTLFAWMNLNFLLFRFFVQAGAVKIQSHDFSWRDFTALAFHYQSQPLPNTWAWYVYKLPINFHKASTIFMFFVELIVPFGLFLTEEIRVAVGIILIGLQVIIWLTGNFSFLNHLTVALCIIAFNNDFLSLFISRPESQDGHWFFVYVSTLFGGIFLILQFIRFWNHFKPYQEVFSRFFSWLSLFHLVNRYGLFAIMTKKRYEIVIEGSQDGKTWQEYLCWYKPSEITRRPRRISPFQPRIDWQMWFLPFDDFESATWFHQFLFHLLKGTPEVLKLVRLNPFSDQPPKYIRALMYDYQFSTYEQKKKNGWWWQRELVGQFSPTLTLRARSKSSIE